MEIIDSKIRKQVLDPQGSFLVQAPAGSGKTSLLVQRFLALLAVVDDPQEILAITFTRKAASEMRQRIIQALLSAEVEPKSDYQKDTWILANQVRMRDREKSWGLLRDPQKLAIMTIDSLCSKLVNSMPLCLGNSYGNKIASNEKLLYRLAGRSLLTMMDEPGYQDLLEIGFLNNFALDFVRLENLFVDMLGKRDQWLAAVINLDQNNIQKFLKDSLEKFNNKVISEFNELIGYSLKAELLELANFAAYNIEDDTETSLKKAKKENYGSLEYWQAISELLLNKELEVRKRVDKNIGFPVFNSENSKDICARYKKRMLDFLSELSNYPSVIKLLRHVRNLVNSDYESEKIEYLTGIFSILKKLAANLSLVFQEHGVIDFSYNAISALSALGSGDNPTDLTLKLDAKIKHILVDEFQDTSFIQYYLLEKLTYNWVYEKNRSMFLVGDPMQSIYKFRQAEISLFFYASNCGIGGFKLNHLNLQTNFRSSKKIVSWINKLGRNIFPDKDDLFSGDTKYVSSYAANEGAEDSAVKIKVFNSENDHAEIDFLLAEIVRIRKENPQKKIAILLSNRNHAGTLIKRLRSHNLACSAKEIRRWSEDQLVYDLLAILNLLIFLMDRQSWYSILRSPLYGKNLKELNQLFIENWPLLANENLNTIFKIFLEAERDKYRFSLHQAIKKLCSELAVPAILENEYQIKQIDKFYKTIAEFEDNYPFFDLNSFSELIKSLYEDVISDLRNPIQIMTIHKAKGLEFDYVFLPFFSKNSANDEQALLSMLPFIADDQEQYLLIDALNLHKNDESSVYKMLSYFEKIKLANEEKRLLYVALTRAKENCIISASWNMESESEKIIPPSGSLLKIIWEVFEQEVEINQAKISHDAKFEKSELINLNQNYLKLPAAFQIIRDSKISKIANEYEFYDFQLDPYAEISIGVLVHALLREFGSDLDFWRNFHWDQEKMDQIKFDLLEAGASLAEIDELVAKTKLLIDQILKSNDLAKIWSQEIYCEVELEFYNENLHKVMTIVPDLLVKTKDAVLIIDYKTAAPNEALKVEEFVRQEFDNYAAQLNLYALAVKKLWSLPTKKKLYFPALDKIMGYDFSYAGD